MQVNAARIFNGKNFTAAGTIDIQGNTISGIQPGKGTGSSLAMPGFIDSHAHLLGVGLALQSLRLNDCTSQTMFADKLRDYANKFQGEWIVGRGWDQNKLGFTPDRIFLDQICPNRPVVLSRTCGHVLVANSRALEAGGVDQNSFVPGGVIKRDATGAATGILEENAMQLVDDVVPWAEPAMLYSALETGIKYAHSCGITGVHTDDLSNVGDYRRLWQLYSEVTMGLPMRCQLHYRIGSATNLKEYIGLAPELEDSAFVYKGAAKFFLDGSLGARTAALVADYSDDQGNKGVLIYPDSEVRDIISIAEGAGVQLAMHAIGDAAIEQIIRVLADVRGGYKKGALVHRVIHCQIMHPSQLERMVALGLMAEIQPVFLQTDMHWAQSRVGLERLQSSYCWNTMDQAGLFMTSGSDAPVEDINPWPGVYTSVLRMDNSGHFAGGWVKDESLSLERALELYTSAGARLAAWTDLGQLKPGMKADIGLYNDFQENLANNKPDKLIIDGRIIYLR